MKNFSTIKGFFTTLLLLNICFAGAQKMVSIDLAATRNLGHRLNGLNISSFYHFSERLIGGVEINRYFPVKRMEKHGLTEMSALDLDFNFHYMLPVSKTVRLYPLTGISRTCEREYNFAKRETVYDRFWSFNTGAGVQVAMGKCSPHAEYMFTWGHINQRFLLVGLSYELEWGKREKGSSH